MTCGWLLACDVAALSLGRARGAVLIGRPLELTVATTLDAGAEGACASADVFYGDTRVDKGVAVKWEPSTGGEGRLRITSSLPVDEPMVTVYLRAGCGNPAMRRYVVLPEMPPEVEPASAARAGQVLPAVPPAARAAPAAADAPARARNAGQRAAPAVTPGAEPVRRAARERPRRTPASARGTSAARPESARTQPRSRLKLEPLDLAAERDPSLRVTSELRTEAAADPQVRQAAAALWQALQKPPEEAMQESQRLRSAERELASLRDATRQNTAALVELRTQMDKARGSRSLTSAFVVGLTLLLAALLGWLAWRWRRDESMARVGRWFEAHGESVQAPLPIVDAAAARRMAPEPAPVASTPMAGSTAPAATPRAEPITGWARLDEAPPPRRGAALRRVGVDELVDVHDKADFFLSIGEHQQAIGALEGHVHDEVETSALAWMDLLELYHRFGKRARFETLRVEFQQRFGLQVPDFDHFDQPAASLENHDQALARIVALWPSRDVLDVIEEAIFGRPGGAGAEPFSLEAYRDLVLLFHIARDMAAAEEAARPAAGSLQPLDGLDRLDPVSELDPLLVPPSSPRLGVDIDLGEQPAARKERPALDVDMGAGLPPGPKPA